MHLSMFAGIVSQTTAIPSGYPLAITGAPLFTPANIPMDGGTQYEVIPEASVSPRLWTGHWSIAATLPSNYASSTVHLLRVSTPDNRIVALSSGDIRLYIGGLTRTCSFAAMGSPSPGDSIVVDVDFASGDWSVAVNGGAAVPGTSHAAGLSWTPADLEVCTDNAGSSSDWDGTVYPAYAETPIEDETLTFSGGTAPYTLTRISDSAVLTTGTTSYTLSASEVGEDLRLTDAAAATVDTATVTSSAVGWHSADEYSAGITNRGVAGARWDLVPTGTVGTGTDDEGPYVDFTGAGRLQSSAADYDTGAHSGEWTLYTLADVAKGATDAGTIVDYSRGGTSRILQRHQTSRVRLFDQSYRDYADAVDGAMELSTFVLSGSAGTGERFTYHGAQRAAETGLTFVNRLGGVNCGLAIGSFFNGGIEFTGKFRFAALYEGLHDAAKRADVRAALKRKWESVDQSAEELRGLRMLVDAEHTVDRIDGSDTYVVTATDQSPHGNDLTNADTAEQALIINDPGSRWNGKNVFVSDGVDDVLLNTSFDLGGASGEITMGKVFEYVAFTSAARGYVYNDGTGYPRFFESGGSGNLVLSTATDAVIGVLSPAVDEPQSTIMSFSSADTFLRAYNGGRLSQEDDPATTRTIADGGTVGLFAYSNGGVPGQYRVAEAFICNVALTPTEALVHACRHNAEYGIPLAA